MKSGKEIEVGKTTPVVPAAELFRDVERMFEDMLSGRWLQPLGWQRPFGSNGSMPSIDLIEHDDALIVRAAVPGYRKEDLSVSVSDGSLTIKGEIGAEKKEEKEDYYFCEMSHGAFSRTIDLPASVDDAKATASMKDGVLELTLPKLEKSKAHSIAIS